MSKFFRFWLGGAAPQTPQILAGGASPPQTHPLNGRSSHLIEAAKRGRLDQMILFSALLTTRAPPGRPAGRPAERPAGRRLTTRAPPTTVRRPTVEKITSKLANPPMNVAHLLRQPEKWRSRGKKCA